jgi:hypothetical protein
MINPVLSTQNFRDHSLFDEFRGEMEEILCAHDLSEYELYEEFLTWLEDR